MDNIQLLAKFTRPRLKTPVARQRLFEWLDNARARPLVWVCAPPGAGKTTLVGSYLETRTLPHLWYQLDAGDGDVATWFHYLESAAQTLVSLHNHSPLPGFTPDHFPSLNLFTQRFFETLFARFTTSTVLVLDNYQDVPSDSPLHGLLAEALNRIPQGVNVMILSRAEPPAAYARLRANGAMAWLDYEQIKLTSAEASAIAVERAREHPGDDITPATIEKFFSITQGWAAGLTLLLERGKGYITGSQSSLLLSGETATPQVVFDYFAGEVFQRLDAMQRNVIMQSALLSDMEVRAVRELTGDEHAPNVLADLARRNYFTQMLMRQEKIAYRFHPLFRAFLLNLISQEFSAIDRAALQRRAAQILEDRGEVEDAINLWLQAGDEEDVARLIIVHTPQLISRGCLKTLATWIGYLPESFVDRSPWLLYWLGQCRLGHDPVTARGSAEQAYELFEKAHDAPGLYLSWTLIVVSYVLQGVDFRPLDRWFPALTALRQRYAMPSEEVEASVTSAILGALMWRAEHVDLDYWRDRAARVIYENPGNQPPSQRILMCISLLMDAISTARIGQAETLAGILRPWLELPDAAPIQRITGYAVLGAMHYQRGDYTEWMAVIATARALSQASGVYYADNMVFHAAVNGALMMDDLATAQGFLREMACAISDGRLDDSALYYYCMAMVALHQGDLDTAQVNSQRGLEIVITKGASTPQIFCYTCTAQILFARGDVVTAYAHLHEANAIATRMGFDIFTYACVLTEAQFALHLGQIDQGLKYLRQALALSRRAQGRFFPLWTRATLIKLFSVALQHDIETDHVQYMIRRLNIMPEVPLVEIEHWPWAVKIYTLDRFTVLLQDGQPLTFTSKAQKRPLELLKVLIALGGREVGVQALIDILWGEVDGDAGQGSFNITLHRLRKLLGDERALVLRDGRLTLSAHHVWVDVWALNRVLGKFEEAMRVGDGAPVEALAEKVFALYRAPFLGDVGASWAAPLRERLRGRLLQYARQMGDYYAGIRRWQDAVRLYEHVLEIEPLAEDVYHRLMTTYQQLNRHTDALMVYPRCERALMAALGVTPSYAVRALYESMRKK